MQLNPIHVTVAKLLEGRLFRIPGYQRAYSWGKNQRLDLFKDIDEAHRSKQDHFMATIVALARDAVTIGADEYRVVELVDGQQRVTTLVILLKAIEKALRAEDAASTKAKGDLSDLLVKHDQHSLVLLQTNHDNSHVFTDYLRKGVVGTEHIVTAADVNVIDAITDCERYVAGWVAKGMLIDVLGTVRNRMSMILHEVADESVVYRVFEVLNSRGLDVKWIDKLKSQLMASIYENVPTGTREQGLQEMHALWQDIYRTIGRQEDHADEALQFTGTFVRDKAPKRILPEEDAEREVLRAGGTELKTIIDAGRLLKTVNRMVHDLHGDVRRRAVTKILHARFVAVAIMLRGYEEAVAKDLMLRWEQVTFRLFGLARLDARSLIKEYVQLGHDIITAKLEACAVAERLDTLGKDYDVNEVMEMKSYWDEWYWRREDVRYVLYRYDESLAKVQKSSMNEGEWNQIWMADPSKTIEHIQPQHTEAAYVHNLGNLTLLPPNINFGLGGKPPSEKATAYTECGLKGTAAVGREILQSAKWDKASVNLRRETLEMFIREHWQISKA